MHYLSYDEVRDIAKDGDIVFLRGTWKHPIQSLIMLATGMNLTHCGILFWMTTADARRLMVVEAQGGTKRRVVNFSYYTGRTFVVCPGPKPWTEVQSAALACLGKAEYSFLNAIYVGIAEFVFNTTGLALPVFSTKREICSEFIAHVYGIEPAEISPAQLYKKVSR